MAGKTDKGRIYTYNLTHPDLPPRELLLEDDFDEADFWPQGISAWKDKDTSKYLRDVTFPTFLGYNIGSPTFFLEIEKV